MTRICALIAAVSLLAAPATSLAPDKAPAKPAKPTTQPDKEGWICLFDGKTLDGWKASEHPKSFQVKDGAIVAHGPRAHLFYVGPVKNHEFKNFEFKCDVKTAPRSNGGLYLHTKWQDRGWPRAGYEAQVCNTHPDKRKTGSLYGVQDVRKQLVKDGEWWTQTIIVRGRRIVIQLNGKTVVDYTEPPGKAPKDGKPGRYLSSGTFALQGHDPKSTVQYKNIYVKPLPDDAGAKADK